MYCMIVVMSDVVSWVGLSFLGSAVVNGGRVEWQCAGFLCTSYLWEKPGGSK